MKLNEDVLSLLFELPKYMIAFGLFEIGVMFFVFGFVNLFFIPKYEWDRLRRDFDYYWPQLVYNYYGPIGRKVSFVVHFIVLILIALFLER